jgi:hypothetical protein
MLYNTNDFSIEKDNNKTNTFTINLKTPNKSLLLSLLKTGILLGGTILDNYQSILFRAISVKKLHNHETNTKYKSSLRMLYYLTKQIEYLISKENKCFYQLDPNNIFIIDDNKFFYLCSRHDLLEINVQNQMTISNPFKKTHLDSPEVSNIFSIPATLVDYKSIYYSLAMLIIYYLFPPSKYEPHEPYELYELYKQNDPENNSWVHDNLRRIQGTKLFYTLERCLQKEPQQRTIIYI